MRELATVAVLLAVSAGVSLTLGGSAAAAATPDALRPFVAVAPACAPEVKTCIGLQVHVATNPAGAPISRPTWLAAQLAEANRHFAKLQVGFAVAGAEAISPNRGVLRTRRDRDRLGRGRLRRGVAHVFVASELWNLHAAGEIRGVHWRQTRRRTRHWVILRGGVPDFVLAHELGHFFGLPHSSYPISIMNKAPRDEPPWEVRTFAAAEYDRMRRRLRRYLRTRELVPLAQSARSRSG